MELIMYDVFQKGKKTYNEKIVVLELHKIIEKEYFQKT